jgi:hypothetical protein
MRRDLSDRNCNTDTMISYQMDGDLPSNLEETSSPGLALNAITTFKRRMPQRRSWRTVRITVVC